MQRSTKALTSDENIDIGLSEGNALLVQLTGTDTPDGTVDFKSTIDGATYNNTPYIAKDSVTASKSVAQLSSITTATTYIILPPMTQARIAVASLTSGTITIAWREIEYSRPFDGTLGEFGDDEKVTFGDDGDVVLMLRSGSLSADEELTDVIEGTSDHQGVAANSLLLSNITNDGDVLMLVSDGGSSKEFLLADADAGDLQIGHGMATVSVKTASGNLILAPGGSTVTTITTAQMLNAAGSVSAPGYSFTGGGASDDGLFSEGAGTVAIAVSGAKQLRLRGGDVYFYQDVYIQGNFFEMNEMAAPGAGGADTARIYAVADGGGLTDLVAVFQDGTTDVFAQETTPLDAPTFTENSGTDLTLKLKKSHPGSVQIVAIFPDGQEFVLKDIQYHDPDKIAANKGTASADLPSGWLVEDATQRAARVVREKKDSG